MWMHIGSCDPAPFPLPPVQRAVTSSASSEKYAHHWIAWAATSACWTAHVQSWAPHAPRSCRWCVPGTFLCDTLPFSTLSCQDQWCTCPMDD